MFRLISYSTVAKITLKQKQSNKRFIFYVTCIMVCRTESCTFKTVNFVWKQ